MKRLCTLLLLFSAVAFAGITEAVEFPYAQFPRQLWERELAWLKNSGIHTLSIPEGGDPSTSHLFRCSPVGAQRASTGRD